MKSVAFTVGNVPIQSISASEKASALPFFITTPAPAPTSVPTYTNFMKSDSYIHKKFAYKHVENIFYFIH
jgi:hypothetical protein